jgi:tRNA pseudouridine38-40 synthase
LTDLPVRTFRMTLEYEGTAYAGWQRQPRDPTIQQLVEEALERIAGGRVSVAGSGRTDAGVHALAQVASFRLATRLEPERLRRALNALLPEDVAVLSLAEADEEFHARFSAHRKTYRYEILNSRQRRVFARTTVHREARPLTVARMAEAAAHLVGRHDFAAFTCSGGKPGGTVRTIHRLDVERCGDRIVVEVEGDGFLYKMVRTIVGTLLEVGRGERTVEDVARVRKARDRTRAGPSAPARGLTLVSVDYAESGRDSRRSCSTGGMEVVP